VDGNDFVSCPVAIFLRISGTKPWNATANRAPSDFYKKMR
jgi:hypothetical protein